jgi:hypothetical protein
MSIKDTIEAIKSLDPLAEDGRNAGLSEAGFDAADLRELAEAYEKLLSAAKLAAAYLDARADAGGWERDQTHADALYKTITEAG